MDGEEEEIFYNKVHRTEFYHFLDHKISVFSSLFFSSSDVCNCFFNVWIFKRLLTAIFDLDLAAMRFCVIWWWFQTYYGLWLYSVLSLSLQQQQQPQQHQPFIYLFIYVPFFVARTGFYNWSHLCGETLWKSSKVADSSRALLKSVFFWVLVVFSFVFDSSCLLFSFSSFLFNVHSQTREITSLHRPTLFFSWFYACNVCLWEVFGLCYYDQMFKRHFEFFRFALFFCSHMEFYLNRFFSLSNSLVLQRFAAMNTHGYMCTSIEFNA